MVENFKQNEKSGDAFDFDFLKQVNFLWTIDALWNNPWKFTRVRTSDTHYIYRYEPWNGGNNRLWIKNDYISQVWSRVEWTKITDAKWTEIKKDSFTVWEIVYLKVPKNIETINKPWEFNFIKNMKDKKNRNWKIYSYTLKYWWSDRWIEDKYESKFREYVALLPGRNFCDKDWNVVKTNGYFDQWETVYIRVPNTDVVDSVPEMTIDDIYKLSDDEIGKIFDSYFEFVGSDASGNRWSIYEHADKNWEYVMINGKKLYIQYLWGDHSIMKKWKPCLLLDFVEGWLDEFALWRYNWNKFEGIGCDIYNGGKVSKVSFVPYKV